MQTSLSVFLLILRKLRFHGCHRTRSILMEFATCVLENVDNDSNVELDEQNSPDPYHNDKIEESAPTLALLA